MKEEARPEAEGLPNWNAGVEEPEVGEAEYLLETTSPLGHGTQQADLTGDPLEELEQEEDDTEAYDDETSTTAEAYQNLKEVSLDYDFEASVGVASD
jgi:hypothetical protein